MSNQRTCSAWNWDGAEGSPCYMPVQRDGLCSDHAIAAASRRRRAAQRAEQKRTAEHEEIQRRAGWDALAAVERVHALLGGPFDPHEGTVAKLDVLRALRDPAPPPTQPGGDAGDSEGGRDE